MSRASPISISATRSPWSTRKRWRWKCCRPGRRRSRRRRKTEARRRVKGALLRGLAIAAAVLASADAAAQGTVRGGTAELSASPVYTAGRNYSFPNGASAKTDGATGIGIQWAYNFDDHWSAGVEGAFSGADYAGSAAPAAGNTNPAIGFTARAETTTLHMAMTYHISTEQFTPFVTVGAGLTGIDASIPDGPAASGCFWYPY